MSALAPRQVLRLPLALSALATCLAAAGPHDTLTFHRDAARSGWAPAEPELTHAAVAGAQFGLQWESPPLDDYQGQAPRIYASPLYVDQLQLTAGEFRGQSVPAVIAATNNGDVYAILATAAGDLPSGTILWRANLGEPCRLVPEALDGVPTGVLATPVIDLARQRLYVTSCEQQQRWRAHALELGSGRPVTGWPLVLGESAFAMPGIGRNIAPGFDASRRAGHVVQRGALNLSPDGARLYVTFGESTTGWLAAIDTARPRIASAFATVAAPHHNSGGIWGAGGPAVDGDGHVYTVTGTGFSGHVDQPGDWVQSVLKLADVVGDGLVLRGTYTPFNYCTTATMDIDLGSGGVTLLPALDPSATATPRLMVVGGKQGNVYLVDRDRMPGALDRRVTCSTDSDSDGSLLPPEDQPQFGRRGPLSVFGPYTEKDAALDMARGRSVPAHFRGPDGGYHVIVTGSTKADDGSSASLPPSIARLRLIIAPGQPAYLRIERLEPTLVFENPGSPVITSNGANDAIAWVLDENARRSTPLAGAIAPRPVLYALDAMTLGLLWKSRPGELHTSGKYNEPAVARGTVFVGTDRIQAFGLGRRAIDGEALYRQRCAGCHDHPEGRIPPRELIAMRNDAYIVSVLTEGAMREYARGLSAADVAAIARYLE
jgi:hypothetical protein